MYLVRLAMVFAGSKQAQSFEVVPGRGGGPHVLLCNRVPGTTFTPLPHLSEQRKLGGNAGVIIEESHRSNELLPGDLDVTNPLPW